MASMRTVTVPVKLTPEEYRYSLAEGVTAVLVMLPVLLIAWGFLLARAWAWFVVPVFGVPGLPLMSAAGIALAAKATLTVRTKPTPEPLVKTFTSEIVYWSIAMLVLLALAQFA